VKLLGALTVIVASLLVSEVEPPALAVILVEVAAVGVELATQPLVIKVPSVEVAMFADASAETTA
jgi:hypothetical protein